MSDNHNLQAGYVALYEHLQSVSEDCGPDLERFRQEAVEAPDTEEHTREFLGRCIDAACAGARRRGDVATADHLQASKEDIVTRVVAAREQAGANGAAPTNGDGRTAEDLLESFEGVAPHPVMPSPYFHGRQIPVWEGFVDVGNIRLRETNERIKNHVKQFTEANGRSPTPDELVKIMSSTANLPGVTSTDHFKIEALARSIAAGGVRQPPILSFDGSLLDGNRRVTACLFVLAGKEFTSEQKARATKIRAWQLTEHATESDEDAVVVSLNFEPDCKQPWPEHVKGQIIYEEWRLIAERESPLTVSREADLKRELAAKFAITTTRCNRYIAMMKLAEEFEDYHVGERDRDAHEVTHRVSEHFQYFDELGKGRGSGGVNWALNDSDTFKGLVFDLLYDGKFRNWSQIRDLKHVYNNDDCIDLLSSARSTDDVEVARERVEDAVSAGRAARAAERKVGGNKRVEVFVKWLREAPVEFFSVGEPGAITEGNLRALFAALKLVEGHMPEAWRNGSAAGGSAGAAGS